MRWSKYLFGDLILSPIVLWKRVYRTSHCIQNVLPLRRSQLHFPVCGVFWSHGWRTSFGTCQVYCQHQGSFTQQSRYSLSGKSVHLPRGTLSTASSIFLLFVFVAILRALRALKFEIWLPRRRSDLRLNDAAERNNSATMPARNESIQTRDNSVELRQFIFWFTLFFDVFVTILHFLLIFFFPFSVPSVE